MASKSVKKSTKKLNNSKTNQDGMKFFKDENLEKNPKLFGDIFSSQLPKQIIFVAIVVIIVIFFFMNFNQFSHFISKIISILTPIILGWVLAFIMAPLFNYLVDKLSSHNNKYFVKFSKVIATIVCTLVVVVVTFGVIFLFVPQLYSSISNFLNRAGGYLTNARNTVEGIRTSSENDMTRQLLQQLEKAIAGIMDNSSSINYSAIASGLFTGFAVSFRAVINYFVGLVVMIYSLNLKEELCDGLKRILFAVTRKDIGYKILDEVRYAKRVFTGFFVGKFLDSFIIGIICYICCLIMHMPYTLLIAVIIGVTNIIPFFGPFIGAIPSFILILLEEPISWKPYGFLIFILILQQVDGNIIGPKILGDKTGVGSFWVLFSILLFGGLFGFVGMIVAVPLWAVISRLIDEFVTGRLKSKGYPLTADDYRRLKEYNLNEHNVK